MTIYRQRDDRWKNVKLGTSSTTLGTHGCTITCIAQLLTANGYNITPPQVNDRLNAVKGYSNGNLVIWSKLSQAYPQIKSATRIWSYNNDTAVKAIKDNKGVLVEVDGSRIGAPKHWVLYIGNGQMIDPWFGTMKSTNYYRPTGMAVLEVEEKTMSKTITVNLSDWEKVLKNSGTLDVVSDFLGVPKDSDQNAYTGAIQKIMDERVRYLSERNSARKDLDQARDALKHCQDNPKVITIEKPVEIIKEVPVEVIKEVIIEKEVEKLVTADNIGALQLITLALKAMLRGSW